MSKKILVVLVTFYFISNLIPLFIGVVHAIYNSNSCKSEIKRVEYIVPGFRIGCYLGGKNE